MDEIRNVVSAKEFEGVRVIGNTIDFGPQGAPSSGKGRTCCRRRSARCCGSSRRSCWTSCAPREAGQLWFKRAVVEGYASQTGKYLFNLNLSLERSARVLCELLREPRAGEAPLSERRTGS